MVTLVNYRLKVTLWVAAWTAQQCSLLEEYRVDAHGYTGTMADP